MAAVVDDDAATRQRVEVDIVASRRRDQVADDLLERSTWLSNQLAELTSQAATTASDLKAEDGPAKFVSEAPPAVAEAVLAVHFVDALHVGDEGGARHECSGIATRVHDV